MPVIITVGVQWGDEGKGKVVDYLAENAELVVRFQGGDNAGHTVVVDGKKTALRLIPSGILHDSVRCLLAAGVVVNPWSLLDEIDALAKAGVSVTPERFGIAGEVQLILPYHRAIDAAREKNRADSKIGTTGKGIGPAYEDAVSRAGIRLVDIIHPDYLKSRLSHMVQNANNYLEGVLGDSERFDVDELYQELTEVGERLRPYLTNVSLEVDAAIKKDAFVMFEGAQGSLLDISHGTYPYVTSSNTVASYACVSAGFSPKAVDSILGISKAYCTRVGGGPFPTEDVGSDGEILRTTGREFGTVTGRPRRCGWFDAVAAKRAIRLNGIESLLVTKLDVLSGFDTIKIAVRYTLNGETLEDFPPSWIDLENCSVEYEEFQGWKEDVTAVRALEDLPPTAQQYLKRLSELVDCRLSGFSVGPDRSQTIVMDPTFSKLMS